MASIPIHGGQTSNELQPLNSTQHWSCWRLWGCPNSSPGVPEGHHALTCLVIRSLKGCHAFWGSSSSKGPRRSSRLDLPRCSILRRPSHLDLPRDSISRRRSRLGLPRDLHPDPGMPGSQVETVLGRMSLHHGIYSHPRWATGNELRLQPLNSTQHWSGWRP